MSELALDLKANHALVDRMIAEGVLWTPALIDAFRTTPRHLFLDRVFQHSRRHGWREVVTREPGAEELAILYSDHALITHIKAAAPNLPPVAVSSSSQPSLMAQMLEDLELEPGQRVLEIGAGTGYNAALMAAVVGPGNVLTVDVDRNVLSEAWDHLRRQPFGARRVQVKHADGREPIPDETSFARLMVTAATPDLEPAWLQQLEEGGRLVAPVAFAPGLSFVVSGSVQQGIFTGRALRPAFFMPLRSEADTGERDGSEEVLPAGLQEIPAPWAGWFERQRGRYDWLGFLQALAFWAWLQGTTVRQGTGPADTALYYLEAEQARVALDSEQLYVDGRSGQAWFQQLWRQWLDLGGPRVLDYVLRVGPDTNMRTDDGRIWSRPGARLVQVWELPRRRGRPPGW